MKICIAVTCLLEYDAIGNDAAHQLQVLERQGLEVFIYADEVKRPGMAQYLMDKSALLDFIKDPENSLIYHHGGCWDNGLTILKKAKCRLFIKYHNITPPEFFRPYSEFHATFCDRGMDQTRVIAHLNQVEAFWCDSQFNAQDFLALGIPGDRIKIVPPFHKLDDFKTASINTPTARSLNDGRINLLFVGRLVPNKGHKHLLGVVACYAALYDTHIRLTLVGGVDPGLKAYAHELDQLIIEHRLEDMVEIRDSVDFDELHTLYACAHIFLLMSGHEGFCLPVLEAQYHDVPVIALNAGAVAETLGANQLLFDRPEYRRFAAAIRVLSNHGPAAPHLARKGRENIRRFSNHVLEDQFLTAVLDTGPSK